MKYSDNVVRSTEYLHQALPLMLSQSSAMTPISYAVWYEYVSKRKPALIVEVDAHLARHGKLDESMTNTLFRKHVISTELQAALRAVDTLPRLYLEATTALGKSSEPVVRRDGSSDGSETPIQTKEGLQTNGPSHTASESWLY